MDINKVNEALKGVRECECILKGDKLAARLGESFLTFFGISPLFKEEDVGRYGIYVCLKCMSRWRDEENG